MFIIFNKMDVFPKHEKGLLDQPVLYLSKYIIVNKDDYYYHLGTVTQKGSWKPWILDMLEAMPYQPLNFLSFWRKPEPN